MRTFTLTADISVATGQATLMSDANIGFSNGDKFLTTNSDTINLLTLKSVATTKGSITIVDDSTADNDVVKFVIDSDSRSGALGKIKTTNIETLEITNSGHTFADGNNTDIDFVIGSGKFSGLNTINLKGDGFSNANGSGLDIDGLTSAVTVNGTAKDDIIKVADGYKTGTVINGGNGNDTVDVNNTDVVNFAKSALNSIETLKAATDVSFWEGAGVKEVSGGATVVFHGKFTNETDNVTKSGDFNVTDEVLTYFDNVVGDVVAITFTGATSFVADKDAGIITVS